MQDQSLHQARFLIMRERISEGTARDERIALDFLSLFRDLFQWKMSKAIIQHVGMVVPIVAVIQRYRCDLLTVTSSGAHQAAECFLV